jgi:sulfur carrier protein ThiS
VKLNVKIFGTLRQRFPDYTDSGIEVEVPDGARVRDLLSHLGFSESQRGVVSADGVVLKADDPLRDRISLTVFQPLAGG